MGDNPAFFIPVDPKTGLRPGEEEMEVEEPNLEELLSSIYSAPFYSSLNTQPGSSSSFPLSPAPSSPSSSHKELPLYQRDPNDPHLSKEQSHQITHAVRMKNYHDGKRQKLHVLQKEKKQWQEERQRLQEKLQQCQEKAQQLQEDKAKLHGEREKFLQIISELQSENLQLKNSNRQPNPTADSAQFINAFISTDQNGTMYLLLPPQNEVEATTAMEEPQRDTDYVDP